MPVAARPQQLCVALRHPLVLHVHRIAPRHPPDSALRRLQQAEAHGRPRSVAGRVRRAADGCRSSRRGRPRRDAAGAKAVQEQAAAARAACAGLGPRYAHACLSYTTPWHGPATHSRTSSGNSSALGAFLRGAMGAAAVQLNCVRTRGVGLALTLLRRCWWQRQEVLLVSALSSTIASTIKRCTIKLYDEDNREGAMLATFGQSTCSGAVRAGLPRGCQLRPKGSAFGAPSGLC